MPYPEALGRIEDIRAIETRGPWNSKSGGFLNVLYAFSSRELADILDVENPGFDEVEQQTGTDIRGLRSYTVSEIPDASVGGMEWHGVRTEMVTVLAGAAIWRCTDVTGAQMEYELDAKNGLTVVQPPGILHEYQAIAPDTTLQVVCNTLFVPDDPSTHDTFSGDMFRQLQAEYAQRGASE